ncbi:MAG: lichenase [Fibrobacteres bacterium]|nr:lichenase [Fibrobacterota bacterium]
MSNAQGVISLNGITGIIPIRQGMQNAPLLDVPVATGEKAVLAVFDSRGHQVVRREILRGESFDFAAPNPGVYHVRITGRNLNVSQSVPVMSGRLAFSGVAPAYEASNALRKSAAAADVTCSKAGYATKTFSLNDGDTKTIGFGVQIGRTFDPANYPKFPGFNLEIAEDFNTADWSKGLTWDPNANYASNDPVWEPSDGGFNDNRVRFNPGNILFKDDAMVFKMDKVTQPASYTKSESDNCATTVVNPFCVNGKFTAQERPITGAEVRTKNNHFRYGRYEVKIDPPERGPGPNTADGFLAAMFTWFTPRDLHWREIDVEILGNNPDGYLTNLFYTNKFSSWQAGWETPVRPKPPAPFDSRAAHTYAFEWLPKSVKWYVDGALIRTYGEGGTTKAKVEISQMSTKIVMNFWILNNDVGGDGAGNQYPIETKFDNFRYYRWNEDGDKKTYPETVCISATSNNCPM